MSKFTTESLDAIICPSGKIKLIIHVNVNKTSGWIKREMRRSCLGVEPSEFTFDHIADEVGHVFSMFPNTEINELLNKIN